jgi:hypothetical protein
MLTAEEYELFAKVSRSDQAAAKWFGIAIGSLVVLCTVVRFTSILAHRFLARSRTLSRLCESLGRPVKRMSTGVFVGSGMILPGRIVLAVIYVAINASLTFTNVNWSTQTLFAKRLGWSVEESMLLYGIAG